MGCYLPTILMLMDDTLTPARPVCCSLSSALRSLAWASAPRSRPSRHEAPADRSARVRCCSAADDD